MAIPDGYPKYMKEKHNVIVNPKTQCLKLTKSIFQAARQLWKKFKEVLSKLGFKTIKSRSMPLH
jgi:hypothetical protein